MFELIIGFAIGLLVGWWLLPQPAFMQRLRDKVLGR